MNQNAISYPILFEQGSPLHQAQQSLQTYFKNIKADMTELPPLDHGFEEKPSSMHICTRILQTDQIYFRCKECCIEQNYYQIIFCQDCFDPKLHEGHQYQQKKAKRSDNCICDCGRVFMVKQSSMCLNHSPSNRDKTVQIKQDDTIKFKQYFLQLFNLFFFLRKKLDKKNPLLQRIQKLISQTLVKLSNNSLYYVRLARILLQTPIKIGEQQRQLLYFLDELHSFVNLFRRMLGDRQFIQPFGQFFLKLQRQHNINQFKMGPLRNQLLNSPEFLQSKAKIGRYFPQVFQNYFKMALMNKDQNTKTNQIVQLLRNFSQKADSEQFVDALFNLLRETKQGLVDLDEFINQIFKIVANFYKRPQPKKVVVKQQMKQQKKQQIKQQKKQQQKVEQQQNNTQNKQQEKKQQKVEQKEQQQVIKKLSKQQKIRLKKCISILCRILLYKCKERIQKLQQVMEQQIFNNKQIRDRVNYMIELMIQNQQFTSFKKKKLRQVMLFILIIVGKHHNQPHLLLKIWNCVIEQQRTFNQNLDNVYDLLGFLCNSYRNFNILGTNQSETYYNMSQKQLKQYLLKCFLYERKEVSKTVLWSDFCFGWLGFDSCGAILNQLCEYNNGHDTFVYKNNSQVYSNKIMKLPDQTTTNWQNVRGMGINYKSECYCQSKTLRNIILTLFKTQQFFNILQANFIKGLGIAEKQARTLERWKQRGVGQNYVLLMVIIDKVCNGQESQAVRQQIMKIKLNIDQYRFRFTQIGNEDKVKEILCVQPQVKQVVPQINEENKNQNIKSAQQIERQQIKKRSDLKRKKIQQKLKSKRKSMLQKLKRQSSVADEQEQNICIFCKEKQKKDNLFVVLANLTVDNLISKILHADQSKTQVKLSTNLHLLHQQCYRKFNKKGVELTCPVCKQSINCFLPYKPNRATKRHLQICWNVMNAAMVCSHNIYETGSLFSVLLNALVQNLGFNQLINGMKSKINNNFKRNVDKFLLQTLTCLFLLSEEQQRQKYRIIVKQFKDKIKTCKKKQLQLFQMVILQAVFFRISGEQQIDQTHVQQLAKLMVEQQLKILKSTLQFVTQGNSDALSSLQCIQLSKISQQALGQNQQRMEQITSLQNIQQKISSQIRMQQKDPNRKILGINLIKLPKKLSELMSPKFLSSLNCKKCCYAGCQSTSIQILCLVCHQGYCSQCFAKDEQHPKTHMNNFITINLRTTQITVTKHNQNRQVFFLYLNPFMIEFKGEDQRVASNEDESSGDQFQLTSFTSVPKGKRNISVAQRNKKFQHRLNQKKFIQITDKFYSLE